MATSKRPMRSEVMLPLNTRKLASVGIVLRHHETEDGEVKYYISIATGDGLPILNPEFVDKVIKAEYGERAALMMEEDAFGIFARIAIASTID